VIAGLVFVLSQSEYSSWRQYQHAPQEMKEDTTTLSPTWWRVTPGPTSTTSPMNSWPMTSPFSMVGMYPPSRWRSDPQVVVRRTRTMTSCSFTMTGSGT
jgi:hypothetical protein